MNTVKRIFFVGIGIILIMIADAQDQVKFSADLEIFSRHYWRGSQMGTKAAIEPSISFHSKGFSLNFWAAQTFDNSYAEIDVIPSFSAGNYTFTLFNYYNPVAGQKNSYFDFSGENSRHSLELGFGYNGKGKLPLSLFTGTFLAGDRHPDTQNPCFSTYVESGFPFQIHKIHGELHLGFTPFNGYYATKPAVVSTGVRFSRTFVLSDFVQIPLKFSVLANPYTSKAFVIFGAGLRLN